MTWSIGKFNNKESEASGKVHLGKACVSLNNGEVMGKTMEETRWHVLRKNMERIARQYHDLQRSIKCLILFTKIRRKKRGDRTA